MPPASEVQYPHLPLIHEEPNPPRQKHRGGGGVQAPDRGGRESFGNALVTQVHRLEEQAKERPQLYPGIDPHLVFRIPVANQAPTSDIIKRLQDIEVDVVSVEPDNAIIAFRDDTSLEKFRQAVEEYQYPRFNPKTEQIAKSTKWDVFEFFEIEQMRLFNREDRIGFRLASEIGNDGSRILPERLYVVDIEIWHRGNRARAVETIDELKLLVGENYSSQERILDHYIGENHCAARVSVTGSKLNILLDMDGLAEVNLPPVTEFSELLAGQQTVRDYPPVMPPPENGPRLCVIDSGIASGHPLLKAHVGHEEAILTDISSPADGHGHGTMVGGLAVFGNIRGCHENGLFASPITLFSARILNDENRFDNEMLFENQIRKAIETFKKPPHNCRVFNLSVGTAAPAEIEGGRRQTQWAAILDELARDLKVIIVVAAGNRALHTRDATEAERVKHNYPQYLFEPMSRLCDPATSAIAITVGALAEHDLVTPSLSGVGNDLAQPVCHIEEPSPFTRTGPGINNAIKPEFVDYGGNLLFEGFGSYRQIRQHANPGLGVMSFARNTQSPYGLFAYDNGTSFAAPRVARIASLLWHRLKELRNEEPHPNLVRAVLATAATVPESARFLLEHHKGEQGVWNVCGYGLISEEDALQSRQDRVTLCTQGALKLDTFKIYAVPVPEMFRHAPGKKTVTVSLAFDPPVRRRRQDYLGVTMQTKLIRGTPPRK